MDAATNPALPVSLAQFVGKDGTVHLGKVNLFDGRAPTLIWHDREGTWALESMPGELLAYRQTETPAEAATALAAQLAHP